MSVVPAETSVAPAAPHSRAHAIIRLSPPTWLRVLVSVGLLTLLIFQLDFSNIAAAVAGASVPMLVVLVALTFAERLYSAVRWQALLGRRASFSQTVRVSFVSSFVGMFLPGVVGAEVLRIAGMARTAGSAASVASVLLDRGLSLVTMIPFVLVGLLLHPLPGAPGLWIAVAASLVACIAMTVMMLTRFGRAATLALTPRIIRPRVATLMEAIRSITTQPRVLTIAILLAIGLQPLRIAVALAAARALHIETSTGYFLLFVPVVNFAALLPISLGGLGVRELGFVSFLAAMNVPPAKAFGASILVYVAVMISVLPGAWMCLRPLKARSGGD